MGQIKKAAGIFRLRPLMMDSKLPGYPAPSRPQTLIKKKPKKKKEKYLIEFVFIMSVLLTEPERFVNSPQ